MPFDTLIFETRGPIACVTLNRPDFLNAFNEKMGDELITVFGLMQEDPKILAAILIGSGERAFCAGADLKDPRTHAMEVFVDFLGTRHGMFFDAIEFFPKPVIAAVNGFAVGAGCLIPLCCDMILASENAEFSLPQVSLGILPAHAGAVRLARWIGKGRAMEMVLTCRKVAAQEAYRIGLVNQVVELKELLPTAHALAERLASMPPLSVRLAKESLNKGLDMPLDKAANADLYRFFSLVSTEDRRKAHIAFKDKKQVKFKGR